jgi:phage shock protein E
MSRQNQRFSDFSNSDALYLLDQGAFLLDVRTKEEYCKGHIRGAQLIPTPIPHPPLNQRETQTLSDQLWWILSSKVPNKNRPIVIYCRKGIRAQLAKKIILKMGYKTVVAWGGVEEPPLNEIFNRSANICTHNPDLS